MGRIFLVNKYVCIYVIVRMSLCPLTFTAGILNEHALNVKASISNSTYYANYLEFVSQ